MIKPIIMGALFLAACQTIGDIRSEVPRVANEIKTSQNGSESATGHTQSDTQPTHEPKDYIQPLDNWLKAQGSPLNGEDFYAVGKKYGIDPDFLIAVTQAETNLGKVKQRGSTCNVGSVGSYDSTATTYACNGYRHGIEQIAQTVTNPNLRYAVRVSELSRKRNHDPNKKIYASSNWNWDTNCIATMNKLKGKNEEDYFIYKTDWK